MLSPLSSSAPRRPSSRRQPPLPPARRPRLLPLPRSLLRPSRPSPPFVDSSVLRSGLTDALPVFRSAGEKAEEKPIAPKAGRRLSTRITGLFKGHGSKEAKQPTTPPATDNVAEEAPKVRRLANRFAC